MILKSLFHICIGDIGGVRILLYDNQTTHGSYREFSVTGLRCLGAESIIMLVDDIKQD